MAAVRARPPPVGIRSRHGESLPSDIAPARSASGQTATSSEAGGGARSDEPLQQEGAVDRGAPAVANRGHERLRQQADGQDVVADVHDLPRDGGSHDRRARWTEARAGVRDRVHGRSQARGVRSDAAVSRPCFLRQGEVVNDEPQPDQTDEPKRRGRRRAAKAEVPAEPRTSARAPQDGPAHSPIVRAQARYVRSSPRKARMVSEHLRGKSVDEARAILAFTPRAVAREWSKLLDSAVANAEHNHELVGEDLRIRDVYADEGPTLRRYRPRAMGRATRIRKRTAHLTITLTPKGST